MAIDPLADEIRRYGRQPETFCAVSTVNSVYNGCDADVLFDGPPGPLSPMRYEGCRGGVEVRMIRVDGLRHQGARDQVDVTAVMWAFFSRYSL